MHLGELKVVASDVSVSNEPLSDKQSEESACNGDGIVSFQADLPVPLQAAMTRFSEGHPNWDQYRLIKAALAGFLVQNGVDSRSITRLYLGNMFSSDSFVEDV